MSDAPIGDGTDPAHGAPADGARAGARLVVFGAGSSLPQDGLGPAGYGIELADGGLVLLDAGPGTLRALGSIGKELGDLRGIVFSHWHADHCADLVHLLFALRNPALADDVAVTLVGPTGLEERLARTGAWLGHAADDGAPHVPDRIATIEVETHAVGDVTHAFGLALEHRATRHTSTAVAWRATFANGTSLCYSGDCGVDDPKRPTASGHADLADLARDVDLLLIECSAPDDAPMPGHLTPASVARIAADARARRVLLTHFYPGHAPDAAVRSVRAHLARGGAGAASRAPVVTDARDGLGIDLGPTGPPGWPQRGER